MEMRTAQAALIDSILLPEETAGTEAILAELILLR